MIILQYDADMMRCVYDHSTTTVRLENFSRFVTVARS